MLKELQKGELEGGWSWYAWTQRNQVTLSTSFIYEEYSSNVKPPAPRTVGWRDIRERWQPLHGVSRPIGSAGRTRVRCLPCVLGGMFPSGCPSDPRERVKQRYSRDVYGQATGSQPSWNKNERLEFLLSLSLAWAEREVKKGAPSQEPSFSIILGGFFFPL